MGPYVRQMMQVRRAALDLELNPEYPLILSARAVGAVPESPHQPACDAECDADDGRRWDGRRRGRWNGRARGHVPSAGSIRRRRRRSRNWFIRTVHSGSTNSRRRSNLGGRHSSELASGGGAVQPVRDVGRFGYRCRCGSGNRSGWSATGLCAGDGADAAAVWGRRGRRRRSASWAVSGGAIRRKSIPLHRSNTAVRKTRSLTRRDFAFFFPGRARAAEQHGLYEPDSECSRLARIRKSCCPRVELCRSRFRWLTRENRNSDRAALSKARFSGFSTTPSKYATFAVDPCIFSFLPTWRLTVDSLSLPLCFALKLLTDLNIAAIQRY